MPQSFDDEDDEDDEDDDEEGEDDKDEEVCPLRRFGAPIASLCVLWGGCETYTNTRTHYAWNSTKKKTKFKGTNERTNQELKHTISSGHGISSGSSQSAPVREFLNPFPTALRMISTQAL